MLWQKGRGRLLASWSGNTLWALRASFEIRRLRRLSRGSADPREYSRSWRLAQSCPAHVARPGSQESAAVFCVGGYIRFAMMVLAMMPEKVARRAPGRVYLVFWTLAAM